MEYDSKEVRESRKEALIEIKRMLDQGNPDELFKDRIAGYYSDDKFLVVWKGNYNGMACEYRIDKTDSFYKSYSGASAIYCSVGLFHEKQLESYKTIERAFIDVGLKLCANKNEKRKFFERYAVPYNEKINSITSTASTKEQEQ